jgi:hypothetical protein
MNFDDTLTNIERPLIDPEEDWLPRAESSEPDLAVDGLDVPLVARLFAAFRGNGS